MRDAIRTLLAAVALSAVAGLPARAATPTELLSAYTADAGRPVESARGKAFFETPHGREWSCSSCHGTPPTTVGHHAATGKAIQPLAPAFDAQRFTDAAKTEKWFRRNCNDVVGRACTSAEKADLLAWLLTLKP